MNRTQAIPKLGFGWEALARSLAVSLATALLSFGALALLLTLVMRILYAERALPGVTAAGIDVAGQTRREIEAVLRQTLTYPGEGRIVLLDGEQRVVARPEELGITIDAGAMADRALRVGREGSLLRRIRSQYQAWFRGQAVPPLVVFDRKAGAAYLERLAQGIDRPVVEATLGLSGLEVVERRGQIGRRLDIGATLEAIAGPAAVMHDAEIALVIRETPPRVLDPSREAEVARRALSEPLRLVIPVEVARPEEEHGPWTLQPAELAGMLRFPIVEDETGATYSVELESSSLTALLEPLAPDLEGTPENARFIFNDDTRQLDLLTPALLGRRLNVPATVEAINRGLAAGQHEIGLVFDTEPPAVTSDATAEELGITQNVITVSTSFAGSSPERIQNIRIAAGEFHGLLVAPGETVSMVEHLGDISLDNGYAEALIIYGNRTIKGVGGGVCQVSTTLFRAAFFGGFPIVERHPHAYRVSYYEQGSGSPGPGLDATVFVPLVDFRFTNDTPYWLLMETYLEGSRLIWKFYSTSDGRQVEVSRPRISNEVKAPEDLYKENPDLPKDKIVQVDYKADGMDVVVTRVVRRGGQVLYEDVIRTRYRPWRAIYEYGPGTELPPGAHTEEDD
jgi:vancomycin resistance protein YoaR